MHRYIFYAFSFLVWMCIVSRADAGQNYGTVTGRMANRAIDDALFKEPMRWKKVSFTFRYNITDDGHVRDVRITSLVRNAWVENAARHALLSLRLPPVPKEIVVQVGHNRLYSEGRYILEGQ
jgi:hypothetical protein